MSLTWPPILFSWLYRTLSTSFACIKIFTHCGHEWPFLNKVDYFCLYKCILNLFFFFWSRFIKRYYHTIFCLKRIKNNVNTRVWKLKKWVLEIMFLILLENIYYYKIFWDLTVKAIPIMQRKMFYTQIHYTPRENNRKIKVVDSLDMLMIR